MEKILTITIPAYNAERYLDKCITSMLVADARERLDIIVVDDGSTDSTGEIADRYATKNPDCVRVIHKANGGHGSGINAAVKAATGKYFRVVDADDWLLTENLSLYLDELEQCEADVVVNSFHRVDMKSGRRIPVEIPRLLQEKLMIFAELSAVFGQVRNCFTIHGITYRTETYLHSRTELTEKIFYEDNEFTTLPFCSVQTIYLSPLFLYQYVTGNQQQSVSDKNQTVRLSHLESVLMRVCDTFDSDSRFSADSRRYLLEKLNTVVTAYLATCLLRFPDRAAGKEQAEKMMGRLRGHYPKVYEKAVPQYQKLLKLHFCHISGKTFDRMLDSHLYLMMRSRLRK